MTKTPAARAALKRMRIPQRAWFRYRSDYRVEIIREWQKGTDNMLTPKERRDLILWDYPIVPGSPRHSLSVV